MAGGDAGALPIAWRRLASPPASACPGSMRRCGMRCRACRRALARLSAMTCAEAPVLRLVGGYLERLEQLGLVEPGQALALLPELLPQRPLRVLLEDAAPLTPGQEAFFSACPWMDVEVRAALGGQGPVRAPKGVRVRFAFPSGQYAWPALLADIVRDAFGEGAALGGLRRLLRPWCRACRPAADDDGASGDGDVSGGSDGCWDGRSAWHAGRCLGGCGEGPGGAVRARGAGACSPGSCGWRCAGSVASWTPRSAGPSARFAVSLTRGGRAVSRISRGMGISPRPMWSVGIAPTWPIGRSRRSQG